MPYLIHNDESLLNSIGEAIYQLSQPEAPPDYVTTAYSRPQKHPTEDMYALYLDPEFRVHISNLTSNQRIAAFVNFFVDVESLTSEERGELRNRIRNARRGRVPLKQIIHQKIRNRVRGAGWMLANGWFERPQNLG